MLKRYDKQTIKTALNMAIPAMIESFFGAFVGLVDSFMVSSLGSMAVASVGLTTQPKFVCFSVFFAVNIAVSALTARRLGEKKRREANELLATVLSIIPLLAIVVGTLAVIFAPGIMQFCGSTPETHEGAVTYFRIIMSGLLFNGLHMAINAMQRGAGNTKITLRTNVVANCVNIVLNYLLIGGNFGFPKLGIAGAALATVLGTVAGCIMSFISLLRIGSFVSIRYVIKKRVYPALRACRDIALLAYSVFIEQLLMRVGFMATALMAAKIGNNAMAAHQVGMNILGLSFSFGDGLQAAAVALIGRSLGEKNPDMAKKYGASCRGIGAVIAVCVAMLYFFGARLLMTLFFDEAEIVSIGVNIMRVAIAVTIFQIQQVIYMGCLRGAGDTAFTAMASTVSVTVVRTVISYVCGFILGWGIVGIWLGILGDQLSRFVMASARFKKGKWVEIKI